MGTKDPVLPISSLLWSVNWNERIGNGQVGRKTQKTCVPPMDSAGESCLLCTQKERFIIIILYNMRNKQKNGFMLIEINISSLISDRRRSLDIRWKLCFFSYIQWSTSLINENNYTMVLTKFFFHHIWSLITRSPFLLHCKHLFYQLITLGLCFSLFILPHFSYLFFDHSLLWSSDHSFFPSSFICDHSYILLFWSLAEKSRERREISTIRPFHERTNERTKRKVQQKCGRGQGPPPL